MSLSDPIADMLTRIRNAARVNREQVNIRASKICEGIAVVLKQEGFIEAFEEVEGKTPTHRVLRVRLKYVGERRERRPVIGGLERVSRPGRRVYAGKKEIPWVLSGMGISILSTSKGVMTGRRARQMGIGGEVLCKIW